jgi:hypothetical protein
MALYNPGSGIPVLQMNRRCPHPKKGAGLAQGRRVVFNTTRNQSPEYDYSLFFKNSGSSMCDQFLYRVDKRRIVQAGIMCRFSFFAQTQGLLYSCTSIEQP